MSYDLEYGEFRNKPLAFLREHEPDYSDARYMVQRWPETFDFVNYTSYDENVHAGSPSEKANYEYWKTTYANTEGKTWWDLGHDGGIFVRIPLLTKDERDSYNYLSGEGYELDEDRAQRIRSELEMEQWDDYGRSDFKDAIKKGTGEDETVESLLDAIPDGAFDAAVFDSWSRSGHYPEVSGWEVTFPDPSNLLTHDENFTDFTLEGVINWLGIGHEVTIRLSPQAFCRLHPGDKGFSYPGAMYIRYGEEWILDVTAAEIIDSPVEMVSGRGASYDYAALDNLIAMHMDEDAQYIGIDQAPSVKTMFNSQMCRNPYLVCDIDYIEEVKLEILQGPKVEWDSELAEKEGEAAAKKKYDEAIQEQQKFTEKVSTIRNLAIDGVLEVCDVDPTDDLVEVVVEQLLLDAPERPVSTLSQPATQQWIKQQACDITRHLLEQRPKVCTLRQLKLKLGIPPHRVEHVSKRIRQEGKKRA